MDANDSIPKTRSLSARPLWARLALPAKILGIVFLALLQLIPLLLVEGLLSERLSRRDTAVQEITSTWGANQLVVGPVLVVPFRYYYMEKKQVPMGNKFVWQDVENSQFENAYFLPAQLKIDATAAPEQLHRGIYRAVVYTADLDLSGTFDPLNFQPFNLGKYDILWDKATLAFPVHDLRGAQEKLTVHFGAKDFDLLPGSTLKFYSAGLHTELPLAGPITAGTPFHLHLKVRGSDNLQFAPVGIENIVHVASSWPNPSFNGPFPPAERTVTAQGFDATWRISYYGRIFPSNGGRAIRSLKSTI